MGMPTVEPINFSDMHFISIDYAPVIERELRHYWGVDNLRTFSSRMGTKADAKEWRPLSLTTTTSELWLVEQKKSILEVTLEVTLEVAFTIYLL